MRQKVIDFDAHILVTSEDVFRDWRPLKAKIDKTPGVVATAPYVQGPVIVEFHNRRPAPLIRGVDPNQEEKVIPLQKFIKFGKLDLEGESTVLGIELARFFPGIYGLANVPLEAVQIKEVLEGEGSVCIVGALHPGGL